MVRMDNTCWMCQRKAYPFSFQSEDEEEAQEQEQHLLLLLLRLCTPSYNHNYNLNSSTTLALSTDGRDLLVFHPPLGRVDIVNSDASSSDPRNGLEPWSLTVLSHKPVKTWFHHRGNKVPFSWLRESPVHILEMSTLRLNYKNMWKSKLVKKNNLHLRHQTHPYTHSTDFHRHHITRVAAWCLKSSKRTAICCSWTQNPLTTSLGIERCRSETAELKRRPAKTHSNTTLQEIYFTTALFLLSKNCWETQPWPLKEDGVHLLNQIFTLR